MKRSLLPGRHAAKSVHFIGIGGSGLSAIARLLLERGWKVSGSDRSLSPLARELAAAGANVTEGHAAQNVQGAEIVVRSSAIPDDNVEVLAAQAAGIPVLKRAEFLGQLLKNQLTIAVAGTHGKTTTTSMIAWLLTRLELDPSYIIGGTAKNLGDRNAHAGKGRMFVIEADEYDRMFLGLDPDVIVVTYLEHDHPDCYPTPQDYFGAFREFIQLLRPGGVLLVSHDHADARRLVAEIPKDTLPLTYGTHVAADYTAENMLANQRGGFDYDAVWHPEHDQAVPLARVSLQVPGEHNVRNSLAALAVVHQVLPPENLADQVKQAALALSEYSGTGRRFEVKGEANGIMVIDDYAHHPTEIQATLAAARARYPERRIWAVWQPHTYSRTRALLADFARSFENADQVVVTEVYAAREKAADFNNFSAAQAAAVIQQEAPQRNVQFVPTLEEVRQELLHQLRPGDVLLVLSAGDADQVSAQVLASLQERNGSHG